MKKNMIAIIVLLGLIAYGGYDYFNKSASSEEVEISADADAPGEQLVRGVEKGNLAPDLTLVDLNGKEVRLADYAGKTVLLNFWATWCPPCRIEMPHMQQFYEDYQSKDVVILGVNLSQTEQSMDDVPAFVEEEKLTFPIVLDLEGDALLTYQIIAYPTTYLIDAKGIVREKFRGAINYDIMKEAVGKVL